VSLLYSGIFHAPVCGAACPLMITVMICGDGHAPNRITTTPTTITDERLVYETNGIRSSAAAANPT